MDAETLLITLFCHLQCIGIYTATMVTYYPNVGKNRRRYKCMEQEKCTRQLVPIAEKSVKCRSNRAVIDLCTAGNVIKNIDHQEDISFFG